MANIKSAKKRILVIKKKTLINKARKSAIKTAIRRFEDALAANNLEEAKARLVAAEKVIAKTAAKGTIHKNAASRKVSALANKFNQASAK